MKKLVNGILYNSETSVLLKECILSQPDPAMALAALNVRRAEAGLSPSTDPVPAGGFRETIGFERLYKTKNDGAFWLNERFYKNAGGHQDTVIPMTLDEAKAWLKDRFGGTKKFRKLEQRIFGEY